MKKSIIVLFLFFMKFTDGQTPQTLYFDPSTAIGAPVSRIFESITYIPLETTKQSLFGEVNILEVTPQYFIVFDYDMQALFFFDLSGKFIKKYIFTGGYQVIAMQYVEKENTLYLNQVNKNFQLTGKEKDELIRNPFSKKAAKFGRLVAYNLNDIEKEQIKEISGFGFGIAMAIPNYLTTDQWGYSFILEDRNAKDSIDYELKISDGNKTLKTYFPYDKRNSPCFSIPQYIGFYKTNTDGFSLFTRPYSYSVYKLTADSISVLYNFVFPYENTIPRAFFTRRFDSQNEFWDYQGSNQNIVWDINQLVPLNHYLFFSLDCPKYEHPFLFDKTENRFYEMDKVSPDSTNAYLPVMGWSFQCYNSTAIYSSVSSQIMFQAKDAAKHRDPVYSPILKSYFENSKPSSNPVIIILKPLMGKK